MKKLRVLLDLDCVLADFVGGVADVWGLSREELLAEWTPGEYPMNSAVGRAAGKKGWTTGIESESVQEWMFWERIERCPGFWSGLNRLPWMVSLVTIVREMTDDWWVVTAPSRCPRCIPEKREWCRRELGFPVGHWFDRFQPTPHKYLFANPSAVLIDDHEENCRKFEEHGGRAILFPAHHNRLHLQSNDPMPRVLDQLEKLCRSTTGS